MKETTFYLRAILAGICIALGGAAFIKVGGLAGAVLFAFGLLCVIHFKLPLYTGMAGFFNFRQTREWFSLFDVLMCNAVGCLIVAMMLPYSREGADIIYTRTEVGYGKCFFCGILCGIIMTLIVKAARDKNVIPLLYGIPLFILCGFYHSVADAFYASVTLKDEPELVRKYMPYWAMIVIGNLAGCNIPRLMFFDNNGDGEKC